MWLGIFWGIWEVTRVMLAGQKSLMIFWSLCITWVIAFFIGRQKKIESLVTLQNYKLISLWQIPNSKRVQCLLLYWILWEA